MAATQRFRRLLFLVVVSSASLCASLSAAADVCASQTLSSNRVFAACSDLPHLSSALHWTYDSADSTLSLAFVAPPAKPDGWVAWAINPTGNGMIGSQALIAFKQSNGSMGVQTYNITAYGPVSESPIAYETSDLAAEYSGGTMRIFGKVKLPGGTTVVKQVWQVGASVTDGAPNKHNFNAENLESMGTLDLVKGKATVSGSSTTRYKNLHGVLNAVSWGLLLPIGATFSRYLKTFKSADPAWFYLHITCQLTGYAVGVGGWATGLDLGSKSKGVQYTAHRNIGITLFTLGTLQCFALLLRPSKDNKYRVYWNIYHHSVGYTVIILGVINVFKGLQILHIDHKWTTGYIIAICIVGGIALVLEVITWIIVLKRKSDNSTKSYNGSSSNGVQQPLSI